MTFVPTTQEDRKNVKIGMLYGVAIALFFLILIWLGAFKVLF